MSKLPVSYNARAPVDNADTATHHLEAVYSVGPAPDLPWSVSTPLHTTRPRFAPLHTAKHPTPRFAHRVRTQPGMSCNLIYSWKVLEYSWKTVFVYHQFGVPFSKASNYSLICPGKLMENKIVTQACFLAFIIRL